MNDALNNSRRDFSSHCNAHLLRELIFIEEVLGQNWALSLRRVLEDALSAAYHHRAAGSVFSPEEKTLLFARYDDCLASGWEENPQLEAAPSGRRGRKKKTKAQNLLARLLTHKASYLAFIEDLSLPFTNNQAERDLRMDKVKQKVSGGFRTTEGACRFAKIRSYIATANKNGKSLLDALTDAFLGRPFIPPEEPLPT